MAMHQLEDEADNSDLLRTSCLNPNPTSPIKVNIEVNGFVVPMEVDISASTCLVNWDTFQKINISSQFILSPTKCKLQTYSEEIFSLEGGVEVEFSCEGKIF